MLNPEARTSAESVCILAMKGRLGVYEVVIMATEIVRAGLVDEVQN